MRRNLIRAAVWAGLFLSAGTAPIFANALDSELQPVASPIARETVPFDGRTEERRQARSLFGQQSVGSTLSCLIIRRSSTASASDGQGSLGPASRVSGTSGNGRTGRRRHRC
jgi:hypothetical protein